MKYFLLSIVVSLVPFTSFAKTSSVRYRCSGSVKVSFQDINFSSNINLIATTFKLGDHLGLWAPIALDIESGTSLTIRDLKPAYPSGTVVYATYDEAGIMGFVTFYIPQDDEGKITIKQFSGIEAGTPFGPVDLDCKPLRE